jgi:hypothetical protein
VRSKLKLRAPVYVCVLAYALGCNSSAPVTEKDLPGLYVAKARSVTDSLRLEPGGQFQHRLWDDNGLAISESGSWSTSQSAKGANTLEFRNISTLANGLSLHVAKPGWWITTVDRDHNGRVTIMINADLGLVYTHIN